MDLAGGINGALRRIPAWTVYIVMTGWVGWLFWLGATNQLGPEPIDTLERAYGEIAIQLLVLGLAVTPLRRWAGVNLMKFRRAIGVSAFFVVMAHFCVWALLDVRSLERVWEEIVKRPYVTVGMLSLVGLIPLALTSNNWSVRRMGAAAWRRLHKLTYPAAILATVHYLWLARGFQIEPIVYAVVIGGLIATRYINLDRFRQTISA